MREHAAGQGTLMASPAAPTPQEQADQDLSNAELLGRKLDTPMSLLGLVFLLVVLGQTLAESPGLTTFLTITSWALWFIFALEFLLRAAIAKSQRAFWKKNWWQVIFLVLPFLRFVRALTLLRFVRIGRVVRSGSVLSSAIRGSRSGGRLLSGRVAWLVLVTGVVILATSQLLYVLDAYDNYGVALHQAAMSTITGSALRAEGAWVRLLEVALAAYSVVVFATLAGSLGAYFLQRGHDTFDPDNPGSVRPDSMSWTKSSPGTTGSSFGF